MIFLSALLRQSIYDSENHRVGHLHDVCVSPSETFPIVTALIVSATLGKDMLIIPWSQVHSVEELPIRLAVPQNHITNYIPNTDELFLKRDILDKQIVDTQGFRVVKVNDLKLAQIKKTTRLVGVDIGFSGLLRRLGVLTPVESLSNVLPLRLPERTITWNYVEPIQMVRASTGHTGQLTPVLAGVTAGAVGVVPQVQLNVSHTKLAHLHPADIADILEQLDVEDAGDVLERLDDETAANTLSEVEYPLQSELLTELGPERASDLLERLYPDDAADILADLPQTEVERLLNLMPADEAQPIRELLRYNAETAGGIMTPEVLTLSQEATVEEALVYLRQNSSHLEMVYYLYIVDEERHLVGVVSLRQLVISEPTTRMRDLMDTDVIKVQTGTDQEEVARVIAKYDLLGVPVVDAENHLVGLITVDDVIDVIHEEQAEDLSDIVGADVEEAEEEQAFSWRTAINRFSWLGVNLVAGFILALAVYQVFAPVLSAPPALAAISGFVAGATRLSSHIALDGLLCLIPMLLLTSGGAASQSLGLAGWRLRTKRGRDFWHDFWRELQLNTFGGVLSSLIVGVLTTILFHSLLLSVAIGLSFGFTLLVASICGTALPNILQRLRLRGSSITAPLLDPVIAVISLSVFLVVALTLFERLHV